MNTNHTVNQKNFCFGVSTNLPRWLLVPIMAFVISRALIMVGAYVPPAFGFVLYKSPTFNEKPLSEVAPLLQPWTTWDADWYTYIANEGYRYTPGSMNQKENYVIFFPLYPVSIHLVSAVAGNTLVAGLLISNVSFLVSLILLYRLVETLKGAQLAGRTVYYVTLFPTSFFFSAVYTESLFFVLAMACTVAVQRRAWLWAGIFGALATATRTLGLFLMVYAGLEWAKAHGWTLGNSLKAESWRNLFRAIRADWPALLAIGIMPLGALVYMLYLQLAFGNALAFNDSLNTWGWESNTVGEVIFKAFQNRGELHVLPYYRALEVVMFFVIQVVALIAWKRFGTSLGLYAFLTIWVGALAADLENQLRYPLVLFPLFMVLAEYGQNRRFDTCYRIIGGVLLVVFTFLFTNYIWIG